MATTYATGPYANSNQWDYDEYERPLHSNRSRDFYRSDSYGRRNSSQHGSVGSRNSREHSSMAAPAQQDDPSPWIHRDKLAQIESREMAEAGIRVQSPSNANYGSQRSRSKSRPGSRSRARSKDQLARQRAYEEEAVDDSDDYAGYGAHHQDRGHQYSRAANAFDYGVDGTNGDVGYEMDTRSGGPVREPQHSQRQHRPSTSRIPVSRNSPAPVSTFVTERESPLARSRNNSMALDSSPEDFVTVPKSRPRSQSLGNRAMLEGTGIPRPRTPGSRPASAHLSSSSPMAYMDTSPPPSSSPHARTPGPSQPMSKRGGVAASRQMSTAKSRTPSAATNTESPSSRPKTSSGKPPNPVNRPEGEAPWLATMYKPDPMLPPDQQMLPTHAKRMMEEQVKNHDREQSPSVRSNVNSRPPRTDSNLKQPPSNQVNGLSPEEKFPGAWSGLASGQSQQPSPRPMNQHQQLPSLATKMSSDTSRQRPTSRSNSTGGYRITPSIPASPAIPNSPGLTALQARQAQGTSLDSANASGLSPATRADTYAGRRAAGKDDEKAEKKKSCGCCIVM